MDRTSSIPGNYDRNKSVSTLKTAMKSIRESVERQRGDTFNAESSKSLQKDGGSAEKPGKLIVQYVTPTAGEVFGGTNFIVIKAAHRYMEKKYGLKRPWMEALIVGEWIERNRIGFDFTASEVGELMGATSSNAHSYLKKLKEYGMVIISRDRTNMPFKPTTWCLTRLGERCVDVFNKYSIQFNKEKLSLETQRIARDC